MSDAVRKSMDRREFIRQAVAGTAVLAIGGGVYALAGDDLTREARAQKRTDGRRRLPPGQRVLEKLKDMGGQPGVSGIDKWKMTVTGEVERELTIDFEKLLGMAQVEQALDVHCVTGWSVLGAAWTGVRIADLAAAAGVKGTARHVIFEAAHGYTANVPLDEALAPECMVAHRLDGKALAHKHGGPVRGVVPDLYFWKSAKWLTGIRFVARDKPGYWEVRGYHNHGDPWLEERYG